MCLVLEALLAPSSVLKQNFFFWREILCLFFPTFSCFPTVKNVFVFVTQLQLCACACVCVFICSLVLQSKTKTKKKSRIKFREQFFFNQKKKTQRKKKKETKKSPLCPRLAYNLFLLLDGVRRRGNVRCVFNIRTGVWEWKQRWARGAPDGPRRQIRPGSPLPAAIIIRPAVEALHSRDT